MYVLTRDEEAQARVALTDYAAAKRREAGLRKWAGPEHKPRRWYLRDQARRAEELAFRIAKGVGMAIAEAADD